MSVIVVCRPRRVVRCVGVWNVSPCIATTATPQRDWERLKRLSNGSAVTIASAVRLASFAGYVFPSCALAS